MCEKIYICLAMLVSLYVHVIVRQKQLQAGSAGKRETVVWLVVEGRVHRLVSEVKGHACLGHC